jgi:hypothetical protein
MTVDNSTNAEPSPDRSGIFLHEIDFRNTYYMQKIVTYSRNTNADSSTGDYAHKKTTLQKQSGFQLFVGLPIHTCKKLGVVFSAFHVF